MEGWSANEVKARKTQWGLADPGAYGPDDSDGRTGPTAPAPQPPAAAAKRVGAPLIRPSPPSPRTERGKAAQRNAAALTQVRRFKMD